MYKNAKIPTTMKWRHPPLIKIYEALGAIADGRVEVNGMTEKSILRLVLLGSKILPPEGY
jgi:hypothetical protein